jgi:uncharacterized phage protein gp47/JayE/predicted RNA-binding protein Jag
MSFEPKKFDDIYHAMVQKTQEQLPGVTDFKVGSVIRTMYESFAYEIALLYEQSHQVYLSAFIDTAEGAQLEMVVAILGIQRGLPDFAQGIVTFDRDLGKEAIEIPINTLVTTEDREKAPKKVYKTIEPMLFPPDQTTVEVKVQAVERGEAEVVAAEAIEVIPQPILGVKSVLNAAASQFRGKRSETDAELRQRAKNTLLASGKASTTSIETALLMLPGVKEVKLKERFRDNPPQHGVIDVFVNGIDFTDVAKVQYLNSQVDRVRAAGVLVRLKPAIPVMVDGVFQIEIDDTKVRGVGDRLALEIKVQEVIYKHLDELGMEQPFLFAQMQRQVLSIEGVKTLETFVIDIQREAPSRERFMPDKYRIGLKEAEKFQPRQLWVTSQAEVALPVRIQFQANSLDSNQKTLIIAALKTYFKALEKGAPVQKEDVQAKITSITSIVDQTLKLAVDSRSPLTIANSEGISVSLVEKASLDEAIFAYSHKLGVIGAIRFTPFGNISNRDQESIKTTIRSRLVHYIDRLNPEEAIDLEALPTIAQQEDDRFTIDPLVSSDFRVLKGLVEETRLNKNKISIQEFEKAQLQYFCISSDIQPVTLKISQLILSLNIPSTFLQTYNLSKVAQDAVIEGKEIATQLNLPTTSNDQSSGTSSTAEGELEKATSNVKERLKKSIKQYLESIPDKLEVGKNLSYESLKQSILLLANGADIQRVLAGTTYSITELKLTATSLADTGIAPSDRRVQTQSISQPQEIHIRSIEKISQIEIDPKIITFTDE